MIFITTISLGWTSSRKVLCVGPTLFRLAPSDLTLDDLDGSKSENSIMHCTALEPGVTNWPDNPEPRVTNWPPLTHWRRSTFGIYASQDNWRRPTCSNFTTQPATLAGSCDFRVFSSTATKTMTKTFWINIIVDETKTKIKTRRERYIWSAVPALESWRPPKYKCEAPCLPTAGYGGLSAGSD